MFRLLIADDEELERRALRLIIERNGFAGVEIVACIPADLYLGVA